MTLPTWQGRARELASQPPVVGGHGALLAVAPTATRAGRYVVITTTPVISGVPAYFEHLPDAWASYCGAWAQASTPVPMPEELWLYFVRQEAAAMGYALVPAGEVEG